MTIRQKVALFYGLSALALAATTPAGQHLPGIVSAAHAAPLTVAVVEEAALGDPAHAEYDDLPAYLYGRPGDAAE